MTDLWDIGVTTIEGRDTTLAEWRGNALLIVNVASKCGYTPQYDGLQRLYDQHAGDGLVVMGFPCNQFLFQEPGDEAQIAQFCSANYGVTFPMFEKVKVRGKGKHPLFATLSETPDAGGKAGKVRWNFEKFLVDRSGAVIGRYRSATTPEDPGLIADLTRALRPAA
jgi:glutathione peroxidase